MNDPFYYQALRNVEELNEVLRAQIEVLEGMVAALEARDRESEAQIIARDRIIAQNFRDAVAADSFGACWRSLYGASYDPA